MISRKTLKKVLALILSFALIFGLTPVTMAGDADGDYAPAHDGYHGYAEDATEPEPEGTAAPELTATAPVMLTAFAELPEAIALKEFAAGELASINGVTFPATLCAVSADGGISVPVVKWVEMWGEVFDPLAELAVYYYIPVLPEGYDWETNWLDLPVITVAIGAFGNQGIVATATAAALVTTINGFAHGGTGTLTAVDNGDNTVTVTGSVTGATNRLVLNIDSNVTVIWQAQLSGNNSLGIIRIEGTGTFQVETGALITNSANNARTIIIDNGETPIINITGGSVTGSGTGSSVVIALLGSGVTVNVSGGEVINENVAATGDTIEITAGGNVNVSGSGKVEVRGTGRAILDSTGTITVSGGTIISNSGTALALTGTGGTINVSGGTIIRASGGNAILNGAGTQNFTGGFVINNNAGTIRGNVTLAHDVTIPNGTTVTIENGAILTVPNGVTLTNNGSFTNNGAINNYGTINSNSIITGTVTGNPPRVHAITFSVVNGVGGTLTATYNSLPLTSGEMIAHNGHVNFTATPTAGWRVKEWTENGGHSSLGTQTLAPFHFIQTPLTITVEFEPIPRTITFRLLPLSEGGGEIHDTRTVPNGTLFSAVSLPANPTRAGFTFLGWGNDNGMLISDFPHSPTIEGNVTFYAQWECIHTPSNTAAVAANCTIDLVCACGHVITAGNASHTWEQLNATHHKCENCTTEQAHIWDNGVTDPTKTCGEIADVLFTCTACGEAKTESDEVIQHNFTGWTISTPATCLTNAIETGTCNRPNCGNGTPATNTRTVANSALGHSNPTGTWTSGNAATCTTASTRIEICARSGCSHVIATETQGALGHTTTTPGGTCTRCGHVVPGGGNGSADNGDTDNGGNQSGTTLPQPVPTPSPAPSPTPQPAPSSTPTPTTTTIPATSGAAATSGATAASGADTVTGGKVDIPISVDTDTGQVTINIDAQTKDALITDALAKAEAQGDDAQPIVTFDLSAVENAAAAELNVSAAQAFSEAEVAVTVVLPAGEITLTPDALAMLSEARTAADSPLADDRGAVPITVEASVVPISDLRGMQAAQVRGFETVISLDVFVGGEKVDVPLTVSLPYTLKQGENPAAVRVWHMDASGSLTCMNGVFDAETGMITFTIQHQSYFVVGYDPVALWVNIFSDVPADAWYYEAVAFANYHGLLGGVGGGLFAPHMDMTRAMFVTLLFRAEGSPAPVGVNRFTDVAEGRWYHNAVQWAAEQGLVSGVGGGLFAPDRPITQREMASILQRYSHFKGYVIPENRDILTLIDAPQASSWAGSAVQSMAAAGVLNNHGNDFNPQDTATRAEAADIFRNFTRFVAAVNNEAEEPQRGTS
ncbi:MAG: S-layer homology domain-containing protein [Defluviitaleaceae bacterium]|nr:S-layer homology domain-containing protein [Defluviitaleaceae bacterium]